MEPKTKHKFGNCEVCIKVEGWQQIYLSVYYHVRAEMYLCIDCYKAIEKNLEMLPTLGDIYLHWEKGKLF